MTATRRASAALAALLAAAALGACGGGEEDDGTESPINTNTPGEGERTPAPNEPQEDFGEEE